MTERIERIELTGDEAAAARAKLITVLANVQAAIPFNDVINAVIDAVNDERAGDPIGTVREFTDGSGYMIYMIRFGYGDERGWKVVALSDGAVWEAKGYETDKATVIYRPEGTP